jgi:hypothetical protein
MSDKNDGKERGERQSIRVWHKRNARERKI